jgi:hypothetical protein
VIGSRAVKNPVSGKLVTAPGRAAAAEKHAPDELRIASPTSQCASAPNMRPAQPRCREACNMPSQPGSY